MTEPARTSTLSLTRQDGDQVTYTVTFDPADESVRIGKLYNGRPDGAVTLHAQELPAVTAMAEILRENWPPERLAAAWREIGGTVSPTGGDAGGS